MANRFDLAAPTIPPALEGRKGAAIFFCHD
jgi:hypothetical protein